MTTLSLNLAIPFVTMTVHPMKRALTSLATARKAGSGEVEFDVHEDVPDLKTMALKLVQHIEKHAPFLTVTVTFCGRNQNKILVHGQEIIDWFETPHPGRDLKGKSLGYVYVGWDDTLYINCSTGTGCLSDAAQANMSSLGLIVVKPVCDISLRAGKIVTHVTNPEEARPIHDFVAWANANPLPEKFDDDDGLLGVTYLGPDMHMFARCILKCQQDNFNKLHTLLEKYIANKTLPNPEAAAPMEADVTVTLPELGQQNEDTLCSLLLDRFERSPTMHHFDFLMQQFHVLERPALLRRVIRELVACMHRDDAYSRAQLELLIPDASHATLKQLLTHLLTQQA
jgi:hypothetical protein